MASYLEGEIAPKTPKVKFVKPLVSSTPTMVPRSVQVMEATPPRGPAKGRRILPPRSQSQSDLTSYMNESQVYSSPITKSRAKVVTYIEVTLQSSVATFDQGKDQLKEQCEQF